jgi:hypothetical protein
MGKSLGVRRDRVFLRLTCGAGLAVGIGLWALAGSASASEIGGLTVAVPPEAQLGPIAVDVPAVVPKASVTVSPESGIAVRVSAPAAVGPIPLLPGVPHDVAVDVGGHGVVVAIPPVTSLNPVDPNTAANEGAGAGAPPQASPPASRTGASPPTPSSSRQSASTLIGPAHTSIGPAHQRTTASQPSADTSDAVNASLRHSPASHGWALFRELASVRTLWVALAVILLVVRWAATGLLRDALRRARVVSSA